MSGLGCWGARNAELKSPGGGGEVGGGRVTKSLKKKYFKGGRVPDCPPEQDPRLRSCRP